MSFPAAGQSPRFRTLFSSYFRMWALGVSVAVFFIGSGPVLSCAFDMIKPQRTAIDWIVDSETLVLARPSEENSFAFNVIRILIGDDAGPPINQLVDSSIRKKLEAQTSEAVLFAYSNEDGWRRVAYVDESFRNILEHALENRPSWQNNMPQSRLDFITALQTSSLPTHKSLVIAELDKVPYAELRKLDIRISDEELVRDLWNREGYPYQAIRALLLGLSGTPTARAEVHAFINRVQDWSWANNLGAFAAAYIELEDVSGVKHLATTMLLNPDQPLDKLEQVVMAMSVHYGIADQPLKTAIQDTIDALIAQRPEAGAIVARQFSLRSDWSQVAVLEPLVHKRAIALQDLLTISVYVARAREIHKAAVGTQHQYQLDSIKNLNNKEFLVNKTGLD